MKHLKKIVSLFLMLAMTFMANAQGTTKKNAEMADVMRSNGRIYVVIAVMLTILTGIILYLVRLERKIHKLEKQESADSTIS